MLRISYAIQILIKVFKKPSSNFTVHDIFDMSCRVKFELSFLKTYIKIGIAYDILSIFLILFTFFVFRGPIYELI